MPQHDPLARNLGRPAAAVPNPYQTPQAGAAAQPLPESDPRSGPPWERRGASLGSFWETARDTLFNSPRLFASLRREGGLGAPSGFAIAGSLVAIVSTLAQLFVLLLIGITVPGEQANEPVTALMGYVIISGCSLGLGPLLIVAMTFLYAAIYHLLLSIVGGANHSFEATFRVVAYVHGASYVTYIVPCFGGVGAFFAMLVLTIIGLVKVQETTAWQACAAVLPPAVLCCGMQLGGWILSGIGG